MNYIFLSFSLFACYNTVCKLNNNNNNTNDNNNNSCNNMYGDAIKLFSQLQCFVFFCHHNYHVCSVCLFVCLSAYFQAIILYSIYRLLGEVQFTTQVI